MNEDEPLTITCALHQNRIAAVVCRHHLSKAAAVGFVENSDDPQDLQAWCDACETLFVSEAELTEKFREFCDFVVVCVDCYAECKVRHTIVSN